MAPILVVLSVVVATVSITAPAGASEVMLNIPQGQYRAQFSDATEDVPVAAFMLDKFPVTNQEFLHFVRSHPSWQRDKIAPLFADEAYLAHWQGSLSPGVQAPDHSPVTNVSWFAARAYCQANSKRLPSMDEWEYVAAAGLDQPKPEDSEQFKQRILDWYSRPTQLPLAPVGSSFKNYWGVWDLHGLVWEWVSDFNSLMTTDASRKDAGGLDRQLFCAAGSVGAADASDYAAFMRYAMRGSVKARHAVANMGFRCARDQAANNHQEKP